MAEILSQVESFKFHIEHLGDNQRQSAQLGLTKLTFLPRCCVVSLAASYDASFLCDVTTAP